MIKDDCFEAFIFARGGSKGVKDKNIKILNNKPLISYSIEQALKSTFISKVTVSTDSEKISSISKEFGAEVIMREKNLATDTSPELDSWKSIILKKLDCFQKTKKPFISLPATSPLRKMHSVFKGIQKFVNSDYDIITSIVKSKKNPFSTQVIIAPDDTISSVFKGKKYVRRQDFPNVYDIAGSFYIANTNYILNCNNIYDGKVGYIEIKEKENLDIDTEFDFHIAKYLLKNPL